MAVSNIQVIDPERLSDAAAKKVPADRIAHALPPGPMDETEVEGQYPYWQYYRCGCGTVFRVKLDTEFKKYFYCACARYVHKA